MSTIQPIIVPKWGMEMEEGTIAEWHVDEGSQINKGDELVDIETSKIVNTLESNYSGVFRKRIANVGVTLPVGSLLGVCVEGEASEADIETFVEKYTGHLLEINSEESQQKEPQSVTNISLQVKASPSARKLAKALGVSLEGINGTGPKGRVSKEDVEKAANVKEVKATEIKISPVAKRLAKKLGVDTRSIKGTGVHGRISKEDIEKAAGNVSSSASSIVKDDSKASATNDFKELPLTATRKTIANRLVKAKQTIPHFYLNVSCQADNLIAFRAQMNTSKRMSAEAKISINDLIIKAAALALQDVPKVNSQLSDNAILSFNHSSISVAIATERGLLTPVVKDANVRPVGEISADVKQLTDKAHSGKLTLDDLGGGTFSISNLGMLGVEDFSAVINPPQAAILAVGTINKTPYVVGSEVEIVSLMKVTLSCDHRLIDGADGADGARWLQQFKGYIESPATMLL